MKIYLVRPTTQSLFQITPPLSLGYLSSALKQNGYNDITLIDGSLTKISHEQVPEIMERLGLPDLIGIQVYTGLQSWAKELVRHVRKRFPSAKIIVGGPHITALKILALNYIEPDFGAIGEGEDIIVGLARYLEGKVSNPHDIAGLMFKENNKWIHPREAHGLVHDVNKIPFPDWDLLRPVNYFKYMQSATLPIKGRHPAPILSSRGCPYKCTFCASGLTNKRIMRYRTPENIVEEIKLLYTKYGVDEIFFSDDNLTMDMERAEKIFDLLINNNIKIHWRAPNGIRIDRLNETLVDKMSKSGCYYVGVGIETGNEEMMKKIKKVVNLKEVKNRLNLLHKYKIKVSGFFICGLIGETEEQINESIRFAITNPFDRIQVGPYIPYPGSEDFETVFNAGDFGKYSTNVMLFQEKGTIPPFDQIERSKLMKIQRRFLFKFYFRFKIIIPFLLNVQLSQLKAILNHPWIQKFIKKENIWFND